MPNARKKAKPARPAKPAKAKTVAARRTKATPPPSASSKRVASPARSPGAVLVRAAKLPAAPLPVKPVLRADSGLSKKELEQFRQMLLHKRAELVGDVTTLRDEALGKNRQDAAGDLSNMPLHMADLGTDNYEQEFALGLIESERAMLREIDEALARIASGTYGVCEATGQPIGKARLHAKPWAKHCYEYVLAQERGRFRGRA